MRACPPRTVGLPAVAAAALAVTVAVTSPTASATADRSAVPAGVPASLASRTSVGAFPHLDHVLRAG